MARFIGAGRVDEIPPGERRVVEIEGIFVVIFNVGGQYYAIEDMCTHDNSPLAGGNLCGLEIECPRHGARFDIRDGRALSLPAVASVRRFGIKVKGDEILVDIG